MENKIKLKAAGILTSRFSQQFIDGNREEIFNAVETLIRKSENINKELRQQFAFVTSKKWPLPQKDVEKIANLMMEFKPKKITDLIDISIINAPNEWIITDKEHTDLSEKRAREIALEFKERDIKEWFNSLIELQKGRQNQTFNFANEIGKIWNDKNEVIDIALTELCQIKPDEQNTAFVEGLLSGINQEAITRLTIDKILQLPQIWHHSVRLNRFLLIQKSDIEKLFPVFKTNPNHIVGLQYVNFDSLSYEDLEDIFNNFISFGDFGRWVTIDILYNVLWKENDKWTQLKPLVESIIQQKDILTTPSFDTLAHFHYEELVKRVLNNNADNSVAIFLTNEIIKACNDFYLSNEFHIREILFILLDNYFDVAWPIIGSVILERTDYSWLNLKNLLISYRNFNDKKLLKWTSENLPDAPIYVMLFVEFEKQGLKGNIILSPIVLELLNFYGNDKRVLDELSAKLHSYSTSGSAVPIFEGRISLLNSLLGHNFPEVRNFAIKEIENFKMEIEREKKWAQNYNLGAI